MTTYYDARQKLRDGQIDRLNPGDISALKQRDPWLARAAVRAWRSAMWWKDYRQKYPAPAPKPRVPVVKIGVR
jgi:hypothetical protein